jgi:RNA polymerase sigma-70 factor (ECF subfamily)
MSSPEVRDRLQLEDAKELVNGWCEKARSAHPELKVPPLRFAEHLAHHLTLEAFETPSAWLPEDLFLALACLESQPKALAVLDGWVRQGKRDEEVAQRARERLLVGPSPRLAQYAGRSSLKAWVGLVAKRVAIDVIREQKADPRAGPLTLAGLIKATPELQLVERDAVQKVSMALKAALEGLDERDRDLLRRHYLEGVTHAELAKELGTSRSSVALWIEKARARLLEETRRGLKSHTRLDSRDLDSLLQVVESNLDLSFSELKVD